MSSGKSTLANAISKKVNISCCHLDIVSHIPNTDWQRREVQEFIEFHDDFMNKNDSWIIEGNYKSCIEKRFEKSSAVI